MPLVLGLGGGLLALAAAGVFVVPKLLASGGDALPVATPTSVAIAPTATPVQTPVEATPAATVTPEVTEAIPAPTATPAPVATAHAVKTPVPAPTKVAKTPVPTPTKAAAKTPVPTPAKTATPAATAMAATTPKPATPVPTATRLAAAATPTPGGGSFLDAQPTQSSVKSTAGARFGANPNVDMRDPRYQELEKGHKLLDGWKTDDAVKQYKKIVKANDTFADGHYWYAYGSALQGETERACKEFNRYLVLAPSGYYAKNAKTQVKSCNQ